MGQESLGRGRDPMLKRQEVQGSGTGPHCRYSLFRHHSSFTGVLRTGLLLRPCRPRRFVRPLPRGVGRTTTGGTL